MKYLKQITALLLSVACLLNMGVSAHEAVDEGAEGTITVEMKYEGEAVTGGALTAYRVGEVQEADGNYLFVKTEAMEAFEGTYENIGSAELAESIAAYVEEKNIESYGEAENTNGRAIFSDLKTGLYLIVQTEASEGYEPLKPFLVSIPMNEDGHYIYDVNAEGKFELYKPVTPPDTPDPELPHTGQLNWPIPVLVVSGLLLFVAGWVLRYYKKEIGQQ